MGIAVVYVLLATIGMFLVGIVLLRMGTKIVAKVDLSFGDAGLIAFLVGASSRLINLLVSSGMKQAGCTKLLSSLVAFAIQFVVASAILGGMIKQSDGERSVGLVKGTLIYLVIVIAMTVVVLGVGLALRPFMH